ncbi:hypothetical protein DIPPA_19554, partial [Diplonema papillatum]
PYTASVHRQGLGRPAGLVFERPDGSAAVVAPGEKLLVTFHPIFGEPVRMRMRVHPPGSAAKVSVVVL